MEAAAATTERRGGSAAPRRSATPGPDRASVILFGIAAVLVVLAVLAWQLRAVPSRTVARPVLIVRRVYQTTVVKTIRGGGSGSSVSQSVSSSGSGAVPVLAPTTRSSSVP
jgi:hypothetical protein